MQRIVSFSLAHHLDVLSTLFVPGTAQFLRTYLDAIPSSDSLNVAHCNGGKLPANFRRMPILKWRSEMRRHDVSRYVSQPKGGLPMTSSAVHAVHDDDLQAVLEALGLARAFAKGELRCKFCDDVMTWENLHSLFPEGGAIKLVCDKPECATALLEHLNARGPHV